MQDIPNSLAARDIASIVHPQTNLKLHQTQGPHVVEHGSGVWIHDDDGNALLDAASGLWCASLGFAPERLAKAAYDQMRKISFAHLYRHESHAPAIELAERLLAIAPQSISKVHFQCTGAESNEVAIKLIWYYHNALGRPEKRKIISRLNGYHGSTVAAASLTGKPDMHAQFNLPLDGFLHVECPHYYRNAKTGESEEDYATRLANDLEALIEQEGPETVAAFFAEPIIGSSGAIPPPRTYFQKVQAILKKHDILFVADEVICGFGRTGKMWGSETCGIEPDLMSCSKALSAGALPISALLIGEKVFEAMVAQSENLGNFAHGHTFAGHPASVAVALETLKIYEEMDLLTHIGHLSACLAQMLEGLRDHPMVGNIDIVGLLAGIELVKDRETKEPYAAELNIGTQVADASQRHGLLHRYAGNRIAFAPAYVTSEDEIAEVGLRLKKALDEVYTQISA
ncbi:MAG: aminotransferase [Hyphomicrobiales bacterium]|nr:aminotransferase [Hyphomicrobiales bacterium]